MEPTTYLDSLAVYSASARLDALLDPLRAFVGADNYTLRIYGVPDAANWAIGALQTWEDQVQVKPGSYLTQITGFSSNALGFRLQLFDEGAGKDIFNRVAHSACTTGGSALIAGMGVVIASFPLPSPLPITDPGVVQVKIANLAVAAANIQVALFFAEEKTKGHSKESLHLAALSAMQGALMQRRAGERAVYQAGNQGVPEDGIQPFDHSNAIATPAVGGAGVIVQFRVPKGYTGVIKRFNCNVNAPFNEGSGDLIWRVLIDGEAVRNYDNIQVQMGNQGSPRVIERGITIDSGRLVQLTVNNVAYAAVGTQSYGSLAGAYYVKQGVRK